MHYEGGRHATRSRYMVVLFLACLLSAPALLLSQGASALFEQGLLKESAEGNLDEAIAIFSRIADDKTADPAIRAKAQLHMGICYEKLGGTRRHAYLQRLMHLPRADRRGDPGETEARRPGRSAEEQASRPVFRKITIPGKIPNGAQLSPTAPDSRSRPARIFGLSTFTEKWRPISPVKQCG